MTTISPITAKFLRVSMLKGVGPSALKRLMVEPDLIEIAAEDLASRLTNAAKVLETSGAWEIANEEAEKQISLASEAGDQILSHWDDDFPRLLSATSDAPFFLYVRGKLSDTPERCVAVIGTRDPTDHGKTTAKRITAWCVEQGLSIVSGLAKGCDSVAHQQALDSDGHTVAVLGHGLHTIYPASNKKLAADILAKGGALVSEFPYGTPTSSQQLVKRDSTQAGFAQVVVMVQSDLTGGSLHASRAALRYGRWLAVPVPTTRDETSAEPKAQANRLLASSSTQEIQTLLKCRIEDLQRLIVLKSREDYGKLLQHRALTPSKSNEPRPEQGALL